MFTREATEVQLIILHKRRLPLIDSIFIYRKKKKTFLIVCVSSFKFLLKYSNPPPPPHQKKRQLGELLLSQA